MKKTNVFILSANAWSWGAGEIEERINMSSESGFVVCMKVTCHWLTYKLLKKSCLNMLNMGLCVSANVFSEDAVCIERVAAQEDSVDSRVHMNHKQKALS